MRHVKYVEDLFLANYAQMAIQNYYSHKLIHRHQAIYIRRNVQHVRITVKLVNYRQHDVRHVTKDIN